MNAQSKKTVYAPKGEKVFTHIGAGLWSAKLFDKEVYLERVNATEWKCVEEYTDKILGEGHTRNEAMREAFYNVMEDAGYSAVEADRLDWVLTEQEYRSYNGHKPRRKGSVGGSALSDRILRIVANNAAKEDTKGGMEISNDPLKDFQEKLAKYKTAYNKVLGGYFYYTRDESGKMTDEGLVGPFADEKSMLKDMVKREL